VPAEIVVIILLTIANLRGVKELLFLLMPIFVGFLVTHGGLIVVGVMGHGGRLPGLIPETLHETGALAGQIGWWAVIGIVLQAFALGGGTYTGIEAVSNNIHMLREPRTVTGRWTMTYMAISLSFAAGGLILLYLLWNVHPQYGQTLNAVTFRQILSHFLGPIQWRRASCCWAPSASPRASSSSPPTRAFSADPRRWPIWRSIAGCRINSPISPTVW
jgi:hypothetical protein